MKKLYACKKSWKTPLRIIILDVFHSAKIHKAFFFHKQKGIRIEIEGRHERRFRLQLLYFHMLNHNTSSSNKLVLKDHFFGTPANFAILRNNHRSSWKTHFLQGFSWLPFLSTLKNHTDWPRLTLWRLKQHELLKLTWCRLLTFRFRFVYGKPLNQTFGFHSIWVAFSVCSLLLLVGFWGKV